MHPRQEYLFPKCHKSLQQQTLVVNSTQRLETLSRLLPLDHPHDILLFVLHLTENFFVFYSGLLGAPYEAWYVRAVDQTKVRNMDFALANNNLFLRAYQIEDIARNFVEAQIHLEQTTDAPLAGEQYRSYFLPADNDLPSAASHFFVSVYTRYWSLCLRPCYSGEYLDCKKWRRTTCC